MKITVFLIVFSVASVMANSGHSQETKLSIQLTNATLGRILNHIEDNSHYYFMYNNELIDLSRKMDIDVQNKSIDEILTLLFEKSGINYKVYDRQIVLSPSSQTNANFSLQQQTLKVSGKVTDISGAPLPGVTVAVKSSTQGTVTDTNGNYSLPNVRNDAALVFSFVGMKTQEIAVSNKTSIDVKMQEEAIGIEEVVAVGYGTQKKESLTSSITSVSVDKLENRSITKLSTALQGITPGVYIRQQTGRPGYAASVFEIRGAGLGTFSSNPPLIIIDGIVDDINNVNPQDVDKISILKDAAAAAIYGSRSTGGVVLITTKRGTTNKIKVNYSAELGVQQQPFAKYKFISSAEWLRANNEAAENDGSPDVFTQEYIAKFENSTDPQYPRSSQWADWVKEASPQQTHNINITGGNEKLNFYSSIGYLRQEGFIPNDSYKQLTLTFNTNYNVSDKLTITNNISFLKGDVTRPANGIGEVFGVVRGAFITPPIYPFYLPNGDYNNSLGGNPEYLTKEGGTYEGNDYTLRMGLNLQYELFKDLTLKVSTATKLFFHDSNNINKRIPFRNNDGVIFGYNRSKVTVSEEWFKDRYLSAQALLEYKKQFDRHLLNIMGGMTTEDDRIDYISASANGFPTNEISEISGTTGTGNDVTGSSSANDWAIASLIGRVNYAFDDKYLIEASARYDGSSRFSPEKRWGLFPSFSVGWRISKEEFMNQLSFISDMKLRASWGKLGNQGSTLYPFAQSVTFSTYPFGTSLQPTAYLGSPTDLSLTWEKKRTTNLGLDFGLLNNQLSGSFDFFKDRTSGIIGRPVVAAPYGASAPIQNTYIIDNRGFELTLQWKGKINKLSYRIGANLSDARDKVISLGGIGSTNQLFGNGLVQLSYDTYLHEGESRNHFYLYRSNGLFVDQQEVDNHAFITSLTRAGDISFTDTSEDGKITPDDKRPDHKTRTPHYFYGFNVSVEYHNFDVSVILNGVGERWDFRNKGGTYLTGNRTSVALYQGNYERRWTKENPDKWADQPRLTNNNWISGPYATLDSDPVEYHLKNFKYLRLKNLQIGYTVPNLPGKMNIEKVRIYFTGENLWTYAPGYTEDIDPESVLNYTSDGSAFFGLPRILSLGLNVTF